jgi:hypothetical protein
MYKPSEVKKIEDDLLEPFVTYNKKEKYIKEEKTYIIGMSISCLRYLKCQLLDVELLLPN